MQVVFTLICGAQRISECGGADLKKARDIFSSEVDKIVIDKLNNFLKIHHPGEQPKPQFREIGHYRMQYSDNNGNNADGRDIFVGIAEIREDLIPEINGQRTIDDEQMEIAKMFIRFFQWCRDPEANAIENLHEDIPWITWVLVPLENGFQGKFNAQGMAGSGKC